MRIKLNILLLIKYQWPPCLCASMCYSRISYLFNTSKLMKFTGYLLLTSLRQDEHKCTSVPSPCSTAMGPR